MIMIGHVISLNEVKLIRDQIKTTFYGDSWHGPSLINLLKDVDYLQAMKKPIKERHSIWELTNHISFWMEAVDKSLMGEQMKSPSDVNDWPPIGESEQGWSEAIARLEKSVNTLLNTLNSIEKDKLNENVPNKNYSYRVLINGALHHNLYHAGQIALLKKK